MLSGEPATAERSEELTGTVLPAQLKQEIDNIRQEERQKRQALKELERAKRQVLQNRVDALEVRLLQLEMASGHMPTKARKPSPARRPPSRLPPKSPPQSPAKMVGQTCEFLEDTTARAAGYLSARKGDKVAILHHMDDDESSWFFGRLANHDQGWFSVKKVGQVRAELPPPPPGPAPAPPF
jgi:hypothetical protein